MEQIEIGSAAALLSRPDGGRTRHVPLRDAELLALYEVAHAPTRLVVPLRPRVVEQQGQAVLRFTQTPR